MTIPAEKSSVNSSTKNQPPATNNPAVRRSARPRSASPSPKHPDQREWYEPPGLSPRPVPKKCASGFAAAKRNRELAALACPLGTVGGVGGIGAGRRCQLVRLEPCASAFDTGTPGSTPGRTSGRS